MSSTPDISLDITVYSETRYKITIDVKGIGTEKYVLPFTKERLQERLMIVNETLIEIILEKDENSSYSEYITDINIPRDIFKQHLTKIAELDLFEFFFIGEEGKDEGKRFKKMLEQITPITQGRPLVIQIILEEESNFQFPWSLIYERDIKYKEIPNEDHIWGFKYIIQQSRTPINYVNILDLRDSRMSLNINSDIDNEIDDSIAKNFIKSPINDQKDIIYSINGRTFEIKEREEKDQVIHAFENDPIDGLIYFFCHAKYQPFDNKSSDSTYLLMKKPKSLIDRMKRDDKKDKITLLNLDKYKTKNYFIKNPLVFLNACETGTISDNSSYNNFMRTFLDKGACGFIGTLTIIPVVFATKFAIEFFKKLFDGERIDKVIYELRINFKDNNNNLLGLLYNSYCRSGLFIRI